MPADVATVGDITYLFPSRYSHSATGPVLRQLVSIGLFIFADPESDNNYFREINVTFLLSLTKTTVIRLCPI